MARLHPLRVSGVENGWLVADYNQFVAASFQFERSLPFSPEGASDILHQVPDGPGVFALYGADAAAQPYLTRAADLRRRITRILAPPDSQAKRLNLRDRVARIGYTATGSEFESILALYHAAYSIYSPTEARRRLKLHTPFFLRVTMENAHPRVYATNRLSRRALGQMYGPFPSRLAAERYADAVLDLFKLRRCYEDLAPHPEHPGCAYGEMKKCLAPCNLTCSSEQYAAEAAAVQAFFDTRGGSLLATIAMERDQASAEMDFEKAASLHAHYQKVKAAAALADELVRPVLQLRAVVAQPAANAETEAAVFLLDAGCLSGPARLSTLGVRAVKEQTSVGSSLFAQPLMLQAVPLDGNEVTPQESPEVRAAHTLESLQTRAAQPTDPALLSDHLSLFRRWYYRPEKQRAGEVFLPTPDGSWPLRRILRGAARMALGDPKPMAEAQRDLVPRNPEDAVQKPAKTKILHEGRPEVERTVPDLQTFTSRRKKRTAPAGTLSPSAHPTP